jgi:hypothetical protein
LCCAQHAGDECDDDSPEIDIDLGIESEIGNPVDRGIDPGHVPAQHATDQGAESGAEQREHDRELAVVERYRGIAVAEGFQQADVGALRRYQARQRHVQQEHGHQHEDGRQDRCHGPERRQFVGEKLRGQHPVAAIRAATAMTCEPRVDGEHRVAYVCLRGKTQHYIVERAIDIERAAQRLASHPHHAKALGFGQQRAGRHCEHELRAAGDADDLQHAVSTVDQRTQLHAGRQQIGFGERFVDQDFVVARGVGPASGPQQHIVHARLAIGRQRH